MNSFLLNRQLGSIDPQTFASAQNDRLVRALQIAPAVKFGQREATSDGSSESNARTCIAHAAGVNSIEIDRFEGRYLLSGGADSSVAIWDLETETGGKEVIHSPIERLARTSKAESLGITHISFYPFDSLAFLTSGYDRYLKIFSSDPLAESASFDLSSIVYSHAVSKVASHLLVACATQHPAVRLVDLRSGANTHSLAGHSGSILAVAWHPRDEFILASGATDGTVRLWDVRRSASSLGVLDMDDHVGITGYDNRGSGARRRERGRAHKGAVNGLTWTDDGQFLVSAGHDERMHVWNMRTGANTLANFGPGLKNDTTTALFPLIVPGHLSAPGSEVVFFPNPREILGFDLHAGNLVSRLRIPGAGGGVGVVGGRNLRPRTTSLAWRAHHVEMCSAHADGTIRTWRPRTWEDTVADEEDAVEGRPGTEAEVSERKRKRDELDQIVRDLTGKRITYS